MKKSGGDGLPHVHAKHELGTGSWCSGGVSNQCCSEQIQSEGNLIDGNLTVAEVNQVFALVNSQAEEVEGGDEDAAELVYDEFIQVLSRCCYAKIPEENRGDYRFASPNHRDQIIAHLVRGYSRATGKRLNVYFIQSHTLHEFACFEGQPRS